MVNLTIDNKKIAAEGGTTVLKAALDNGIFIPYFCWHPTLSVSGNCRMCVVEVKGRPKLEVSCNLPVEEGLEVMTDTSQVRQARKDVLEFLLINHPLDCPICDQAGECLLQDYHFEYSGAPSRFKEQKVKRSKAVDIGRNVKLDNERCILCSRCVRFCAEIAKTHDLCIVERGDASFVTAAPGRSLDNPYSMNTVDLCPVGALTSKDFRFKKRVWLLKSTPSVCPKCSDGCPIWLDHADGTMYRWRPRGESTILCDVGRLSYKEWQPEARLHKPLVRQGDELKEVSVEEALEEVREILERYGPKGVIGAISARCSCEEIDAFVKKFPNSYGACMVDNSFVADNMIRKADTNPNTAYLEKLNVPFINRDVTGDILITADALSGDEIMNPPNFKWKAVVQITHNMAHVFPGASVVLPRATFAETSGTFVNFAGVVQKFEKAFEAKGEAKSVKEWIDKL